MVSTRILVTNHLPNLIFRLKLRQKRDKKNNNNMDDDVKVFGGDDGGGIGCCGVILQIFSWILVICTFPLSLFVCLKMVQEYERAVIFRVGRLLDGGAKGFI